MYTRNTMYNQKKIGNAREIEFAKKMYEKGWWVHRFADKVNGQPCDIIMCKNNTIWFLDVKNVKNKDYLLHSRIEPNQINTFKLLNRRGIFNTGFAVRFNDGWYHLDFKDVNFKENSTSKKKMRKLSI